MRGGLSLNLDTLSGGSQGFRAGFENNSGRGGVNPNLDMLIGGHQELRGGRAGYGRQL